MHLWPDLGLVFVTTIGTPIDPNKFSRTFACWRRDAHSMTSGALDRLNGLLDE